MATYHVRGVTTEMITAANARAREAGTSLDRVLRAVLEAYAAGHDTAAQQLAAQGGHARAQAMTSDERSASARRAVRARWAQRSDEAARPRSR